MILVVLTSHRTDCFSICLACLEEYTEFTVFDAIYIVANEVSPEHMDLIVNFAKRNKNTVIVDCSPRGMDNVMAAQDLIYSKHKSDVVVKLDEDVFVTSGWLQGLLKTYNEHRGSGCGIVSSLVPNNQVGRLMLEEAFCEASPHYAKNEALHKLPISQNTLYPVWLWTNVLAGKLKFNKEGLLKNLKPQKIEDRLSINCILLDPVFLDIALPFSGSSDEVKINMALFELQSDFYGMVTPDSVAHHYSFFPQQDALDKHINVPDILPVMIPGAK